MNALIAEIEGSPLLQSALRKWLSFLTEDSAVRESLAGFYEVASMRRILSFM